ncbi:MAG: hypothetical protein IPL49_07235 [Saprospirales bacterium]|nr:hypothetical protein [Saprospirales bacterium]MBK8490684.1 hypothetical protein [Saprospirales bacterium]
MEIPRWKKWLSYFVEWHVESAPSSINPHLYVSLSRGRYQLSTARAIYSFGDLYENFTRSFRRMKTEDLQVENVLLLGLGLGSVPFMLERVFQKNFHYTAVEIDESVIYLANKYVLSSLQSPVEVVCTDALAYVQQCTQTYDLIAMDIFLEDVIPGEFESVEYLRQLASLLTPHGVLLFNRLSRTPEDLRRTQTYYRQIFRRVFPASTYLDVSGNWMLVNRSDVVK